MDQGQFIIEQICRDLGVSEGYHDIWGRWHPTMADTKRAFLRAMGLPVESAEEIEGVYREIITARYRRVLDRTIVCEAPILRIPVRSLRPELRRIKVTVIPEDSDVFTFEIEDIALKDVQSHWGRFYEGDLNLPKPLGEGYHRVLLEGQDFQAEALLVGTPRRAFLPKWQKAWGLNLHLYALSSSETQGIGDLALLKHLMRWVLQRNGRFILINPIHYNDSRGVSGRSPYYPLSRLYFNPIYINLRQLPWLRPSEVESLKDMETSPFIDYEKVSKEKDHLLRVAFGRFLSSDSDTEGKERFKGFCQEEGSLLEGFALYVCKRMGKVDEKEVLYQKFLQWCIREQMKDLPEGVFFDLALGTRQDGFDLEAFPGALTEGISVGAPPDDFSPRGQNWGFPPLSPLHLLDTGLLYFIELLKRNIPKNGGIRVDHIAGLQRLFWIPQGAEPEEGTYVYYPIKQLLGILCLESKKKKAIVVGEDLGTIEPTLRTEMQQRDLLSFKVFYFEKDVRGEYKRPDEYPEKALITTTTHDLPTLWGFYKGQDIKDRLQLGRYSDQGYYERDIEQRKRDIQAIRAVLRQEGLLEQAREDLTKEEMIAIYRFLWRSPCRLMAFQMDDLLGVQKQQNMPGTTEQYPNWQRRYPATLEEAMKEIEGIVRDVLQEDRNRDEET